MEKNTDSFVWEDYAVKELEKKNKVKDQAKIDGLTNNPPSNSESYSVV